MNFEFGHKGKSFGLIALICWVAGVIINLITGNSPSGFMSVLSWGLSIAVLVTGILAFVNGRKELAADPNNKDAKLGRNIGLVIIILQIIGLVVMIAGIALLGAALSA